MDYLRHCSEVSNFKAPHSKRPEASCMGSLSRGIGCHLQGRKINFANLKNFGWLVGWLVGWWMSRPTGTRVTFDLPECKERGWGKLGQSSRKD